MKQELYSYWCQFCLLNALIGAILTINMVIYPQLTPIFDIRILCAFLTLPLILNSRMKTKISHRLLISIGLFFLLKPILPPFAFRPTLLQLIGISSILGLLSIYHLLFKSPR